MFEWNKEKLEDKLIDIFAQQQEYQYQKEVEILTGLNMLKDKFLTLLKYCV